MTTYDFTFLVYGSPNLEQSISDSYADSVRSKYLAYRSEDSEILLREVA